MVNKPKNTSITIDGRRINTDQPPYIIAELSANHNGQLEAALALIEQAKQCGAHAVKLQTYTADTITLDVDHPDFKIDSGLWAGKTLYELYDSAHTPWDWHPTLFDHAKKCGITLFSSPFDHSAVDFLEDLNTPAYKIASFEAIDLPLIRYAASTGKPMIVSTGMASVDEIEEAVDTAKSSGCTQLAILHCVSAYPAAPEDYNLRTIADMIHRHGLVTGLSDHTLNNATAIASIALGASLVEKHFTLNRQGGGPDDSFSMEPDDLQALCSDTKTVWQALGQVNYNRTLGEEKNIQFRRSLYVVEGIKKGDKLSTKNIKSIRPGFGLPPKYFDDIVGKQAARNLERGTPLSLVDIE